MGGEGEGGVSTPALVVQPLMPGYPESEETPQINNPRL